MAFPVAQKKIFLAHAGVTALPSVAAGAMKSYITASCEEQQEFSDVLRELSRARHDAASLLGAEAEEIALLGPTALGLSLFANGLDWRTGDEVILYGDDYPANVYPWLNLQRLGVVIKYLEPESLGKITPEVVEAALTPATRLVALSRQDGESIFPPLEPFCAPGEFSFPWMRSRRSAPSPLRPAKSISFPPMPTNGCSVRWRLALSMSPRDASRNAGRHC